VPPRPRTPHLYALYQPALALNGFVHRLAFRDHVIEHIEHTTRAAEKRELQERELALAGAGAVRHGSAPVDDPEAAQ
jgi:hypothetical protein